MSINSPQPSIGKFPLDKHFLFAYNKVKVTKLYATAASEAGSVVNNGTGSYNEGYDLSRLFGYEWASDWIRRPVIPVVM